MKKALKEIAPPGLLKLLGSILSLASRSLGTQSVPGFHPSFYVT